MNLMGLSVKDYICALERKGYHDYMRTKPFRVTVRTGKSGPWAVRRFQTHFDLQYVRFARDGRPPGLGKFTALSHEERGIVMSDTVPEIDDLRQHLGSLKGHILVTGLGLGMAIQMLTDKKYKAQVKSITVIEKDADVIKLVAKHYLKDKRVTIIHADAYTWLPPRGTKFDCAWHDIWDAGGWASSDGRRKIRRHYKKLIPLERQFCWGGKV